MTLKGSLKKYGVIVPLAAATMIGSIRYSLADTTNKVIEYFKGDRNYERVISNLERKVDDKVRAWIKKNASAIYAEKVEGGYLVWPIDDRAPIENIQNGVDQVPEGYSAVTLTLEEVEGDETAEVKGDVKETKFKDLEEIAKSNVIFFTYRYRRGNNVEYDGQLPETRIILKDNAQVAEFLDYMAKTSPEDYKGAVEKMGKSGQDKWQLLKKPSLFKKVGEFMTKTGYSNERAPVTPDSQYLDDNLADGKNVDWMAYAIVSEDSVKRETAKGSILDILKGVKLPSGESSW